MRGAGRVVHFQKNPGVDENGNLKKKFGFIQPDDGSEEIYFNEEMVGMGIPHGHARIIMGQHEPDVEPHVAYEIKKFPDNTQARYVIPYVKEREER